MDDRLIRCGRMLGILVITVLAAGCQQPARHQDAVSLSSGEDPRMRLQQGQIADVQIAMARTLEKQGQTAQAIKAYTEGVHKDPRRADAWLRLAVLHDKQGQFQESAKYYQRAVEVEPSNPNILTSHGYSLYLQDRWDEAERELRNALEVNPAHRRAHNNLGLVLARLGKQEEAIKHFREAGCSAADAHCNLAYVMTLQGDRDSAARAYQLALQADPASLTAQKGCRDLELLARRMGTPTNEITQAGYSAPAEPLNSPSVVLSSPKLSAPDRSKTRTPKGEFANGR